MKTSDYIVQKLIEFKIKVVFGVTGGASIHLLHSLSKHPKINFVPVHHEQVAAMAADGYARNGNNKKFQLGCAIATSGPGATNLITGIAGAFYDSVPIIFITGQVASFRLKKDPNLRQFGFQETSIVEMVKPIVKYAVQVQNLRDIDKILNDCYQIALSPRQGPVLIDIPDDFQRISIPSDIVTFKPFKVENKLSCHSPELDKIIDLLKSSERPVVILGSSCRDTNELNIFLTKLAELKIPLLTTWGGKELVSSDYQNLVGTFGTHGTRYGNFTVQNSDLIISIGSRLSNRETGSPMTWFGREAKLVVIDIDTLELAKFQSQEKFLELGICIQVDEFIKWFNTAKIEVNHKLENWVRRINLWKKNFNLTSEYSNSEENFVNPYSLFSFLNENLDDNEIIILDTGLTVAWACQMLQMRKGQRLIHDFANTAMGWALPAGIGIINDPDCFNPITIIVGDGSLMMNLQDLINLNNSKNRIRILLLNNSGYGMVRQTEDQWLDSNRSGTSEESGLKFPNFEKIAEANGFSYKKLCNHDSLEKLTKHNDLNLPILYEIMINPDAKLIPQSLFGYPLEDMDPLLPRSIFLSNMIIKPLPASLNHD